MNARAREKNDEAIFHRALLGLAASASAGGGGSGEDEERGGEDPVVRVLARVAAAAGAGDEETFAGVRGGDLPLPGSEHGAAWTRAFHHKVQHLLRRAHIRWRRVALEGEWWTADAGPMIGATKTCRPIALLPRKNELGGSAYDLIDGETGAREVVTRDVASQLVLHAFSVQRSFPERPLGWLDVLAFAFHGSGRELARLVLIGALIGAFGAVPALLAGAIFSDVVPAGDRRRLFEHALALVVFAVTSALLVVARGFGAMRLEEKMAADVQRAVWHRLFGLPAAFFRRYSAGELAARANSVDGARRVLAGVLISTSIAVLSALANVAVMFDAGVGLGLAGLGIGAFAGLVTTIGAAVLFPRARRSAELSVRTASLAHGLLAGITKVRTAAAEARAFAAFADRLRAQRSAETSARHATIAVEVFQRCFPLAASAAVFAAVALLPGAELTAGEYLVFHVAFAAFLASVLELGVTVLRAGEVVPLLARTAPILAARPEVEPESSGSPVVLGGELEVTHLGFRYREDGPPVLDDVSFHVRPGEMVAFVGPSGCGKSTLLRLLLGFEGPAAGAIFYDGQDLSRLDREDVRRQLGVVLQAGAVLDATILENIGGGMAIGLDEAREAARIAALEADIDALPMGFHTYLSKRGATLSGGQRQRLVLARAVARKPRILLLDEATSALDNRTQAEVTKSLAALDATRIVIAHRLSTIQNADRIYVLDRGRIVQSGTYDELISKPGLFADLARRQLA
jgi:ATP-binding cassette subfamily C protein